MQNYVALLVETSRESFGIGKVAKKIIVKSDSVETVQNSIFVDISPRGTSIQ